MKIAGKVAVVTGGSSGIGQAVVRALIEKGGRVAIFDLNEVAGQAIVGELGAAAIFAKANVSDEGSVAAAIAKTMAAFGADLARLLVERFPEPIISQHRVFGLVRS